MTSVYKLTNLDIYITHPLQDVTEFTMTKKANNPTKSENKPENKSEKIDIDRIDNGPIPALNEELDEFLQPGLHEAIAEFTTQAQIYFPQILDDERDQAAAKVHLDSLQEHINHTNQLSGLTSKQDADKVSSALKALLKIGDKKQDDMMACALLDYIDEILQLINDQVSGHS